jgi:hypothetical protein
MTPVGTGPEIYMEYVVRGSLLQATAIDPATGAEASVFGPVTASREALTRNAIAKLTYILNKNGRTEE